MEQRSSSGSPASAGHEIKNWHMKIKAVEVSWRQLRRALEDNIILARYVFVWLFNVFIKQFRHILSFPAWRMIRPGLGFFSVLQVIVYTWLTLTEMEHSGRLKQKLPSAGCFLLSCDGDRFVLGVYKLSAEVLMEKKPGSRSLSCERL